MKNTIHKYNSTLLENAKSLRKNMTFSEARLWKYIKGSQMNGYDFHRQKVIGNFIVDFYCPELKLAIEIDGGSHDEKKFEYDVQRQKSLENLGIRFLRFTEKDVLMNIKDVLSAIENYIS